ncbi:MAG: TetR family transcriptional regulator [Bdellovibrionales bacterium]|nr:TetR family transcriptional regulator [Bdellovibrionales bacterium]
MSDSEVLLKAFDVIACEGFSSFTFEQVGRVVGLSPAALVKRFKNKSQLALLARNLKWEQNLDRIDSERFEKMSGLKGIFDFLSIIAQSVNSNRLGEHAMWLGKEACHPKSKRRVADYFETTRGIFVRLLTEAIEKGELIRMDNPKEFARTLEALVQGAIFQFAFLNERSIETHLRDHFRLILNPYLKTNLLAPNEAPR